MTDTIKDGGPAFPHPALANEAFCPSYDMGGMSLRDWFAGQALAGIIAGAGSATWEADAANAFKAADAMLAARAAK